MFRIVHGRIKTINTYSYSNDFINTYDLQYDLIRYVRRNTARILLYGSPNILDSIRKKFMLKYESPDYTVRTIELVLEPTSASRQ